MRYSSEIRIKVRNLRLSGETLDGITQKTRLPRTTIYLWIKDIQLTDDQIWKIKANALASLQQGRIRTQAYKKNKNKELESVQFEKGFAMVGEMKTRDVFIAGVALYWAEGFKNKHERRLGFCNSDPTMIQFYLRWLKECMGVSRKEITARVTLNISYKEKTKEIESYWSELTHIPKTQFTRPFYQTSQWKRLYNNERYRGVLRIHVRNSWDKLVLMRGMINGLRAAQAA